MRIHALIYACVFTLYTCVFCILWFVTVWQRMRVCVCARARVCVCLRTSAHMCRIETIISMHVHAHMARRTHVTTQWHVTHRCTCVPYQSARHKSDWFPQYTRFRKAEPWDPKWPHAADPIRCMHALCTCVERCPFFSLDTVCGWDQTVFPRMFMCFLHHLSTT
jgi:hypothetical protein